MGENTEFNSRYRLAKFVVEYVDYVECASKKDRLVHGSLRKLGDIEKKPECVTVCHRELLPRNEPYFEGLPRWGEIHDCLYTSGGLEKLLKKHYEDRNLEVACQSPRSKKESKPCRKNRLSALFHRDHYISKLSREFTNLLRDGTFRGMVRQTEFVTQILQHMWCPTRPLESVGQYAIAKHASIHYILSTHAILPSSECFTFDDIQRIMHLPMEWIGSLPRREDARCITKFIARFAELFSRKPSTKLGEFEDPMDEHARQCGQRVFFDIIRYASSGNLPDKPPRRVHQTLSVDSECGSSSEISNEMNRYPPLDWEDQLSKTNVKIVDLPAPIGRLPPKITPFRRAITGPPPKQQHNTWITVDEVSVMRESNQVMSTVEAFQNQPTTKAERYKLSRALKRASDKTQCVSTADRSDNRIVASTLEQLENEETQFKHIVSMLPHRMYSINKLKATNRKVLAGLQPPEFSASWLRDPIHSRRSLDWTHLWDPNRRIHVESAIRFGRLPPLNDTVPTSVELVSTDGISVYRGWQPSILSEQRLHILSSHPINSKLSEEVHGTGPWRKKRVGVGDGRMHRKSYASTHTHHLH